MSKAVETIIEPRKGWIPFDLRELWNFRELLFLLAWRDVKVKYKQTLLGAAWVILQPVIAMAVFSVLFGRFAKLPSDGIPYPIFVFAGLLPWNYFAGALSSTSGSLIASSNLVTKVYFPRIIIPTSSSVAGLLDLFVASSILWLLMFVYGVTPSTSALILVPLLVAMTFLVATGTGLWLAALNVEYRDFQYVVPFFIQIMLFLTPVIYPVNLMPEKFQWLLWLNPMTGVIETLRAVLFSHQPLNWPFLTISTVMTALLLAGGLAYFKRVERYFADVI